MFRHGKGLSFPDRYVFKRNAAKVLLISSLLHDPDLLFLDEPLSGLDANSVMVVKEVLAQLSAQGKTIFIPHILWTSLRKSAAGSSCLLTAG